MEKVPELPGRAASWALLVLLAVYAVVVHVLLQLPANAFRPEFNNGDALDYHLAALNLYQHGFQPHPTRMFGFPLLTGWIVLFDPSFRSYAWCCYVFNAVCWLGSIWLLLGMGRQMFGAHNRISLLPALLFGINIGNIVLISQPVTETLYVFLLLLAGRLWLRYLQNGLSGWAIAAFAVFCYTTVVRPTATIWLLVFIPALLLHVRQHGPALKKMAVGMVLSLVMTLGLQVALMKARYDLWVTSNIGLLTYYLYVDAYASSETPGASWSQRGKDWEKERDHRKEILRWGPIGWKDLVNDIDWKSSRFIMEQQRAATWSDHRPALLQSYARNLVSNSLGTSMIVEFLANRSEDKTVVKSAQFFGWLSRLQNALYSFLTMLFALLAGCHLFIRKRLAWFDFLALFNISILLFSAISFAQGDRFHLVFMPFAALLLIRQIVLWTKQKPENILGQA